VHRQVVYVTGCVATVPPLTRRGVTRLVRQAFVQAGYTGVWARESVRVHTDLRLETLVDPVRDQRGHSEDQAVCIGWAGGREQDRYLPRAHRLAWLAGQQLILSREEFGFGPDGKVLARVEDGVLTGLSLSIQHAPEVDQANLYRLGSQVARAVGLEDLDRLLVNGGGDFTAGGPEGDNGLSGKKLVVDAYGPTVPIGGGAWCGKDPHKVDRLGGLLARHLALRAVRWGLGAEALVTLGWQPGDQQPSTVEVVVDGQVLPEGLLGTTDLSISGNWAALGLGSVDFAERSDGSWFQRAAPWEGPDPSEGGLHGGRDTPGRTEFMNRTELGPTPVQATLS
jgi:S-adenosylmethionine synthetase